MRVLLDTHVLAWAVGNPDLLSKRARAVVTDTNTDLLVSPASIWEMSIKLRKGKWPEVAPFMDIELYRQFAVRLGLIELPISSAHARQAGQFNVKHGDPFDRMLCAQALNEGISIVSRDDHLDLFPIRREW